MREQFGDTPFAELCRHRSQRITCPLLLRDLGDRKRVSMVIVGVRREVCGLRLVPPVVEVMD